MSEWAYSQPWSYVKKIPEWEGVGVRKYMKEQYRWPFQVSPHLKHKQSPFKYSPSGGLRSVRQILGEKLQNSLMIIFWGGGKFH